MSRLKYHHTRLSASLFLGGASWSSMPSETGSERVVMFYIDVLDHQRYDDALNLLHDRVRIRGPAGETFGKPLNFIEMLQKYQGNTMSKRSSSTEMMSACSTT
jgi:hypothetical protein